MPQPSDTQLAEQIRKGVSAERVELGARIQSLWGGYGELRRVELFGARAVSAVLKSVAPPPEREFAQSAAKLRSHRRKLRSYEVELAFYRGFAKACDAACRVPELLHGEARQDRFLFVLSDLDAAGFPTRRTRCDEREVKCWDLAAVACNPVRAGLLWTGAGLLSAVAWGTWRRERNWDLTFSTYSRAVEGT